MRPLMKRIVTGLMCAAVFAACGGKKEGTTPVDSKTAKADARADARSGPDGKRSGAQVLRPNVPKTDEVSYVNADRTDWYAVELKGKGGVLTTQLNWDVESSDVMIDVFNELGRQISNSPVKDRGRKDKTLLTQIEQPGTYYIRITAPTKIDATVYTVVARWEEPLPVPPPQPVVIVTPPLPRPEPEEDGRRRHPPRPPRQAPDDPPAPRETVQGRILQSVRDGQLTIITIDKGSAAGMRVGMTGNILDGATGEEPLEGGAFRITKVDSSRAVGVTQLRNIGRNTRVAIGVGK